MGLSCLRLPVIFKCWFIPGFTNKLHKEKHYHLQAVPLISLQWSPPSPRNECLRYCTGPPWPRRCRWGRVYGLQGKRASDLKMQLFGFCSHPMIVVLAYISAPMDAHTCTQTHRGLLLITRISAPRLDSFPPATAAGFPPSSVQPPAPACWSLSGQGPAGGVQRRAGWRDGTWWNQTQNLLSTWVTQMAFFKSLSKFGNVSTSKIRNMTGAIVFELCRCLMFWWVLVDVSHMIRGIVVLSRV